MKGEKLITVAPEDDGARLDRWLKKNAHVPYALIQKLIRKGAIKIDGKKAKADQKLAKGQVVRLPKIEERIEKEKFKPVISEADAKEKLLDNVIYKDKYVIAINKPPGLPAQGGSGVRLSVDDMLDFLKFERRDRPKLVHRIDKDTSGVMLIARTPEITKKLGKSFESRDVKKIYWALVKGVPLQSQGKINLPLATSVDGREEKTVVDEKNGKRAVTYYKMMENAGKELSWLMLMPITGRKHQIRVHLNAIGHPIVGDGKYGGKEAFIDGLSKKMHLHARRILVPDGGEKTLDISAPLPRHMKESWEMFGFDQNDESDIFEGI